MKLKTMKNIVLLTVCVAGLAAPAVAQPAYINYQGRLLDLAGQPLTNGSYTLEFNIYDSPTGTNRIWGPHTNRAVVANGRFNVILGPEDAASPTHRPLTNAFQGDERFMEIKVNGGSPILPRQQVLSAPYAMRASSAVNADKFNSLPPTDYFLPPGMVVPFAGTNIPTGWLPCNGASLSTSGTYARLFAAIGYAWGGSGSSFNLPDLRGMFLRGVNGGRGGAYADPDAGSRVASPNGGNPSDNVGSHQANQLPVHRHIWSVSDNEASVYSRSLWSWTADGNGNRVVQPFVSGDATTAGDDDSMYVPTRNTYFYTQYGSTVADYYETRPNNAYVNYIIKY